MSSEMSTSPMKAFSGLARDASRNLQGEFVHVFLFQIQNWHPLKMFSGDILVKFPRLLKRKSFLINLIIK